MSSIFMRLACQICVSNQILFSGYICEPYATHYCRKAYVAASRIYLFVLTAFSSPVWVMTSPEPCDALGPSNVRFKGPEKNICSKRGRTSALALSRNRRGTLRTSWLAALRRKCRGSCCQARCEAFALAFFIATCMALISYARALNKQSVRPNDCKRGSYLSKPLHVDRTRKTYV